MRLLPITYYWTVPLILDHAHISFGNEQVRKLLIQKCQDFRGSKAFVSAIFNFSSSQRDMSGPILGELSNDW
jgi:hypothetical protein